MNAIIEQAVKQSDRASRDLLEKSIQRGRQEQTRRVAEDIERTERFVKAIDAMPTKFLPESASVVGLFVAEVATKAAQAKEVRNAIEAYFLRTDYPRLAALVPAVDKMDTPDAWEPLRMAFFVAILEGEKNRRG